MDALSYMAVKTYTLAQQAAPQFLESKSNVTHTERWEVRSFEM